MMIMIGEKLLKRNKHLFYQKLIQKELRPLQNR